MGISLQDHAREISKIYAKHEKEIKDLTAKIRVAFDNGAVMLANDLDLSFVKTAKVDLDKLWDDYQSPVDPATDNKLTPGTRCKCGLELNGDGLCVVCDF